MIPYQRFYIKILLYPNGQAIEIIENRCNFDTVLIRFFP